MIILGIDTSGYANAVGVVDGEQVLADFVFEARTDSLEKIVANIDHALKSAGLGLDCVQGIGAGLGPGSWTGIRVGVTVGKILAFSTGRPVAGVPTLEALAYGARDETSLICPVISAGTGDGVYAAFYRPAGDGFTREGDYYVGPARGLVGMIKDGTVFVGSEEVLKGLRALLGDSMKMVAAVPGGAAVAHLASLRLERGDMDDALSLTPLYLKESTAKAFINRYTRVKG